MKKIISLIVFGLAMCGFTFAQSPLAELEKIKEIKLLESTQDDVRKLLADYNLAAANSSHRNDKFSTENAHIEIWYSRGDCSIEYEEWNVLKWTVTEIVVSPINSLELKDSGFDYSKFRKEKRYKNLANQYIYHNKDLGIAVDVHEENEVYEITYFPSKENYSLLCNKDAVRKRYLGKSIFANKLKDRIVIIDTNSIADVVNLNLSLTEITASCNSESSNQNCSNEVRSIFVSTLGKDPENDPLIYDYKITGGKIIGQGANVVWDLSGVKPGTYTITAAVDDGCGLCGKSITKTVIVKECPSCSEK